MKRLSAKDAKWDREANMGNYDYLSFLCELSLSSL